MIALLDTNICIYLIRERPASVRRELDRWQVGDVGVSTVTVAELRYGAAKSAQPVRNHNALDAFLLPLVVFEFGAEATVAYGEIRARLERAGTPIGPLDTMIAAHAVALGARLVSNNEREFARVPGLRVENWAA